MKFLTPESSRFISKEDLMFKIISPMDKQILRDFGKADKLKEKKQKV